VIPEIMTEALHGADGSQKENGVRREPDAEREGGRADAVTKAEN